MGLLEVSLSILGGQIKVVRNNWCFISLLYMYIYINYLGSKITK